MSVAAAERTLPSNLEAERSVLGAILLHNEAFPLAAAIINVTDLFRDAHRRIFEKMIVLSERGDAIDFVTLKEELGRAGELDEVGGPAYIAALVDGLPRSTNVEQYARIVKEKARLRGLIFAANKLIAQAYEQEDNADVLIEDAMDRLLSFAGRPEATVKTAHAEALAYVLGLDAAAPTDALATGFLDLDEMLSGGVRPQELVVLAGRPSAGKSSLGLGMAKGLALHAYPTVFFSLEMRARALGRRLVSWGARVDKNRMDRRYLNQTDYERITAAVGALDGAPIYLQDSAATLTEVSAWCQRLKGERGITCAVVDYLQLLLPERRSASREVDVAGISRGLKRLAVSQHIAVVALSALNRSPEGRKDNRPRLSDLRESGALEQDADVVLLLHRQEQYDQAEQHRGVAEVIVAKNREGATGCIKLAFSAGFGGLFANLVGSSNG